MTTLDAGELLESLGSANYVFVAPAVGLYLVSILFRTLRWQALLRHIRQVSISRLYITVVIGYMANNLLPMRLGELVRSYYLSEREGVSKTSALVTIVVERLLDALTLLFFISIIGIFVPLVGLAEAFGERSGVFWPFLVAALALPFLGTFTLLLLIASVPTRATTIATALSKPLPRMLQFQLLRMFRMFLDGLKSLARPTNLVGLFLMSMPIWLFEAGLFFLIGYSFHLDKLYDSPLEMAVTMVLVTAIANIGSSVPAAPGGIGLFEIIARETLVLLPFASIDRSLAGGYVAVVHTALLLPMIVLGQVFLWTQNLSLSSLSRANQTKRVPPSGIERE